MEKYKWGIIGLGHIAESFAKGLTVLENAELYAVASRQQEKANSFASKYNAKIAYGSYEDIVNDKDVDVIYIATPHNVHFENALMCLENKKAILCEKPLTVNTKQTDKLILTAVKNNTFLMEALWTRFLPKINKAIEIIDSGVIGNTSYLRADFGFNAPYLPQGRLFNPDLAGGALLDVGIYTIFYALQFFGYPDKITAHAKIGETGVDENCSIHLEYKDGKVAQLFCTIIAETPMTVDIAGTKAHLTVEKPLYAPSDIHINNKESQFTHFKIDHIGNGYNYEAMEVMQCLEEGKLQSDKISWEFSRNSMKIMDEVRRQIGLRYPFE